MGRLKLAFSFIFAAGFFLGLFLRMTILYSEDHPLIEILGIDSAYFIAVGMIIVSIFWLIYSIIISKITDSDLITVLETDSKTYLPLMLLSFYSLQFTPTMDNAVNAFAAINSEFTESFLLLPAKLILLLVINLILFLKLQTLNIDLSKLISRIKINARGILLLFIFSYALIFSYLSISIYQNYHSDFDLAIYNQAIWSTTKGEVLETSLERGTHPGIEIASHFSNHFSPVFFL
jgi:hypothetical protein